MRRDVTLVRLRVGSGTAPHFRATAFAVFASAVAVGTLVHEWNSTFPELVAIPAAVAAFAVLLRPASPVRFVVLLAVLAAECVSQLPDPVNHQVLLGILGTTLGAWWLTLRLRTPQIANDPAEIYERTAPYLRLAFILMWFFAAFAKINTGFTDPVSTCAVWILESIPVVAVPAALTPVAIVGTIAVELAVPTLLLFHRTRPLAIMLAFPFHVISAFAGHSWFSGFAWAFYALFLPPATLARGVRMARRMVPDALRARLEVAYARPWLTLAVVTAAWVGARYVVAPLLPGSLAAARQWGAVLLCVGWMTVTAVILWRLRRSWVPSRLRPRARLVVRNAVMWVGIALLAFNAACPYLGVKTGAAFTMFSNLQTEPGHWNPVLVPESVRVVNWLDGGDVRFLETDDPRLDALVAEERAENVVLIGARRIVEAFPDASVRYLLDGEERLANPVSADPVLGVPLTTVQRLFGEARPYADGGTCQH